jgi:hypothetical protein
MKVAQLGVFILYSKIGQQGLSFFSAHAFTKAAAA